MQPGPRQYPAAPQHVYLFATCLVDLFVPQAGLDSVRLLEREGLQVHYPRGQSCCGQPAYSSGNPEQARAVARAQLGLFGQPWPVIVPSGSCAGMMRHHWPRLFEDDPVDGPRARELAGRVYELAEFLVCVMGCDFSAGAVAGQRDETVVLHTSCGARERMLGRLRAAAPKSGTPVAAIDSAIDQHYAVRRTPSPSPRALLESMQAALRTAQAQVDCVSAQAWPSLLAARLGAQQVRRLLLDTASAEGRALQAALPAGIEALPFARPLAEWKSELFDTVDAGFTVARSGIAATGTLIVAPDAGAPRTVSLAPPLHVALVYASTLHADMHAAARAERWADGMPSNLVLISSPSKTSDIQQTLAYGAHGPRWLWVLLVDDLAPGFKPDQGAQP